MALGIVETAVEAVRAATEALGMRSEVVHTSYPSRDSMGAPQGAPVVVTLRAIVTEGEQEHVTKVGKPTKVTAHLLFFPEVEGAAPPAFQRQDEIRLPSGRTAPIVDIDDAYEDPDHDGEERREEHDGIDQRDGPERHPLAGLAHAPAPYERLDEERGGSA